MFLRLEVAPLKNIRALAKRPFTDSGQVGPMIMDFRRGSTAEASFLGCHGNLGDCEAGGAWDEERYGW